MSDGALIFSGRAGVLGAAAVKVALTSGVNGNAALLFGRMTSFNGKPFWELRKNLAPLFNVSTRTVTRYFRALVDAGLIYNKPAPLKVIHPGCKKPLPFRPWYKWVIGLPALREAVKTGSREAYERWQVKFEEARRENITRSKLGAIIGSIVSRKPTQTVKRPTSSDEPSPRRWSPEEIDAELRRTASDAPPPVAPDTS